MDFRFQRQKCFITGLKTTLQHCGEHPFRKIAFLEGDVSNLADSHPNVHLRIGGGHQLNHFVFFKSNKHTICLFCSTEQT